MRLATMWAVVVSATLGLSTVAAAQAQQDADRKVEGGGVTVPGNRSDAARTSDVRRPVTLTVRRRARVWLRALSRGWHGYPRPRRAPPSH